MEDQLTSRYGDRINAISSYARDPRIRRRIGAGLLLVLAVVGAGTWFDAERRRSVMVDEMRALPVPAEAVVLREQSGSEPTQSHVTRTFRSYASAEELLAFYVGALTRQGWTLRTSRELNGRAEHCFLRAGYRANLEIDPLGTPDSRYALTISWGGRGCS